MRFRTTADRCSESGAHKSWHTYIDGFLSNRSMSFSRSSSRFSNVVFLFTFGTVSVTIGNNKNSLFNAAQLVFRPCDTTSTRQRVARDERQTRGIIKKPKKKTGRRLRPTIRRVLVRANDAAAAWPPVPVRPPLVRPLLFLCTFPLCTMASCRSSNENAKRPIENNATSECRFYYGMLCHTRVRVK